MLQRCGDMALSITWLKFLTFCKKAWVWIKKNWQLFAGIAIALFFGAVFRKKIDMSKIIDRVQEDHSRELELIEIAREEELKKLRLADKKYMETIQKIESQYAKELEKLDEIEREKIKEILYESGDDADELTNMLAHRFKFRIIDGGRS